MTGQWQWQKEECVTADGKKIFRPKEAVPYRLVFEARQVQMEIPEQAWEQSTGYEGTTCDVIVKGVYEWTFLGSKLKINFKDNNGKYRLQPCHNQPNQELKDEDIKARLFPYFSGADLEVKEHPSGELQITLPGVSYCENQKMKVFFKKR